MKKGIIIAFGEMFLKSRGVKEILQKRLVNSLRFFLKKEKADFKILSLRDRIIIITDDIKKSSKVAKKTFGISWFGECFYFGKAGIDELSEFIKENYKEWIKENESYALKVKSNQIIKKEAVIEKIAKEIKRKVNLSNPNKEIFIEIKKQGIFLYLKKKKGPGGLPFSGRAFVLMSGGIDSPVSAFSALKRGIEGVWVHFHSFPLVSDSSIKKTEELAKKFLNYQARLKVYYIPFSSAQIEIKSKSLPQYRVLLYRRLMLKIAEEILKYEKISGIITGESLGQVSSQTIENIAITEEAVKAPVLRPLIAMDKEEIIGIAKKIGTFDISIKPQEDCCTLFVSGGQTAKGDIKLAKDLEKKINTKKLIRECLKNTEVKIY